MIHAKIVPDPRCDTRRREERVPLSADIPMREFGTTPVDARLINISSHGFMAEADAPILPGTRVWLTLPGVHRVNAEVIWARSGRLGGEFTAPIDPMIVFHALGAAQE